MADPYYATPKDQWPTALEAAQEPPTGPASGAAVIADLCARLVELQAAVR
jgi:hypothetical protein